MPQRRAAKKDLRKNAKRHAHNLVLEAAIKTTIKKFKKSLQKPDVAERQKALIEVHRILDKAASKKLIHANNAARKKSRLAALLKKTPAQPA